MRAPDAPLEAALAPQTQTQPQSAAEGGRRGGGIIKGLSIWQQVLALMAATLIVAHVTTVALIAAMPRPPQRWIELGEVADRMGALARALNRPGATSRAVLAQRAGDDRLRFTLEPNWSYPLPRTGPPGGGPGAIDPAVPRAVEAMAAARIGGPDPEVRLGMQMRFPFAAAAARQLAGLPRRSVANAPLGNAMILGVRLDDNTWLIARPERRQGELLWLAHMSLWFLVTAMLLAPLALLFSRRLAAPIGAFAVAAERLGRGPEALALREEGPREVRAATRAFNTMHGRIQRFVADRTLMLAAISHDLRTPLQRLRFRIDSLPDDTRAALLADIEEMEAMLSSTLAFARDDAQRPPRQPLDLGALVASVCDDAADSGGKAQCAVDGRIVVTADPIGLKRAIANLVANAIKYAGAAEVQVRREGAQVLVEVADRGPGIPQALHEAVFQPFRRLEPSRSRATGGTGLGLSIARTIARGHGGDVALAARPGGGLVAALALPA